MREELKFGIEEADKLIQDFENGDISFLKLTCGLWNGGYNASKEEQQNHIKKLEFMIENGLGWEDMKNDI